MSQDLKDVVIVEKPELTLTSENGELVRVISQEDELYLTGKYDEIIKFMRDNHSQDISDEEKDSLYIELQKMWNEVSGKNGGRLNEVSFNLILNRDEYRYLTDLIVNKMEYDVDTIFFAEELIDMINDMRKDDKFLNNESKPFNMTPVDIHYLYQLLSKHTVKGLSKQSRNFSNVIRRIALSSKVFNYYKELYANLAKSITIWVHSLDKGTFISETDNAYKMIWGDSDVKPVFAEKKDVETVEEVVENE